LADAVERFESAFARWLGVRSAFAFWKGRVALYAILRALGIGEGDEVIIPGYTCVVVANPIKYLGATPVYVDIEPITYNIDPDKIEAKISPRTRLIVAQHTYGYPAEMDAILAVANRHGIPVIEDACLAVGSMYKGRRAGTFGLAAYWSFQWSKAFTTGVGGMATTNDPDLADTIAALCEKEAHTPTCRETAMLGVQRAVYRAVAFPRTMTAIQWLYRRLSGAGLLMGSSTAGEDALVKDEMFFKCMSGGQARAGLRGMRRLEANISHRRHMKRVYDELLAERGWPMPKIPAHLDPLLVRYPVRVADKAAAIAAASRRFVELGNWFDSPLHQAEAPLHVYNYREGMCPEAEKAVREVVNLPTHRRVNERVAKACVRLVCEIGPAGGGTGKGPQSL
jgi:dTDP-4-amino-4,6-dideoxygalactose transaminase